MAKPHGNIRGANLSHQCTPFETIHTTTMETKKTVTSAQTRILSRPFTKNQVKVSFQDHPPNVPKMDPNLVLPRPSSLKTCKKRVLSRPLRMDLKMTLLSRPWVKKGKNQLLSRPLQIELKTLTPNTWSPLMRQVKSFQILSPGRRHNQSQNCHPAVHLLQDQDSTPSMWSQDQCPLTVPGIFKCCSPTALTASETCRASMTSRQTQLSHQSSTEDGKFQLSTRRRSRRS